MQKHCLLILAFFALCCFASLSAQSTWVVKSSGGDFSSISAALAAGTVLNGDTLHIQGTITEQNISINKNINLKGDGMGSTIIQANAARNTATARVFTIGSNKTVFMKDLTIRHGKVNGGGNPGLGGGVYCSNGSSLSLLRVGVVDNDITGGTSQTASRGGGIFADNNVTLRMELCLLDGNYSFGKGGALALGTTSLGSGLDVDLINTTLSNNEANESYSSADGGAIYTQIFSSTLDIVGCTFEGNKAGDDGGAIFCRGAGTAFTMNITNSTFSGNRCGQSGTTDQGGALYLSSNTFNLLNVTIAFNQITSSSSTREGAGLFVNSGNVTMNNCLLSNNSGANAGQDLFLGVNLNDNNNNLVVNCGGDVQCPGFQASSGANLGALANNGGPTLTHALLAGSNATNAGSPTVAPPDDQRGYLRNVGLPDIGAYEFGASPPTPPGPTALCQNLTVPLSAAGTANISASALNGGSFGGTAPLTFAASQTSFTCNDIGINTETLTVTDANSATATCTATVNISDVTPPTAVCQPVTVQLGSGGSATIMPSMVDGGSSDACGGSGSSLSRVVSPSNFNCSQVGQQTVTLSVYDAPGNSATCTATVTVKDNTPPTATCNDLTVDLDVNGQYTLFTGVIHTAFNASDACGLRQPGLSRGPYFTCSDIGTAPIRITVFDNNLNPKICDVNLTINDPLSACCAPPTARCKNATVNLNALGFAQVMTSDVDNGSTAPCGLQGIGVNPNSFGCNNLGPNTVTLTVTDVNNLNASCTANVTIADNIPPSLSLLGADPIVICEGGALIDPGATINDNCGSGTVQGNKAGVNTNQQGTYSITYNYTDPGGNAAAQITRTIIVENTPAQLAPQNCGSCSQIRFDFCEGDPTPNLETLLQSNSNYEAGTTFNWYDDNSGSQGGAIGTPSVNTSSTMRRYYWVSQQDGNCEGPARRVRVRVRATSIVVFNLPSLGCNSGQLDLAAYVSDSRGKARSFTFYDSDPDAGSPTPLGTVSATNGVVNPGQQVIVNVPPNPITYYATAGSNTGCQVTGSSTVVSSSVATLNPISNITVNSGTLVNLAFPGTNVTYVVWFDLVSANNPNIGIMGAAGLGNLMFTARNTTSSPLTATIRVVPYNGNCAGTYQDFTITVNPGIPRHARNSLLLTGARLAPNMIQLDWDIQYEFSLTHVEVERLQSDGTWYKVSEVAWHADQHSYSFVDATVTASDQTYRLKLVHPDGRVVWSREIEITNDELQEEVFYLYPNPTDGRFSIRGQVDMDDNWRFTISDPLGRTIKKGELNEDETSFDLSDQPTGQYYLILVDDTGQRFVKKVIKQ